MHLDFDLTKFSARMLPTFLRKPIMLAWMRVQLAAVNDLFVKSKTLYTSTMTDLNTFTTTDSLQARLRVHFPDVGAFKVFIKNKPERTAPFCIQYKGEHHHQEYIYMLSESLPKYTHLLIERLLATQYEVYVPTTYSGQNALLVSLLDRFKPAGKNYTIIYQNITS